MRKETMCRENIGEILNNGPVIDQSKPVRMLDAVLGNNPTYTALSDKEIYELSRANEDAWSAGRNDEDYSFRIKFDGLFSLNNICYSIIRPCRCVVKDNGSYISITTARFITMNSISRLVSRLNNDSINRITIYKLDNDGNSMELERLNSSEDLISHMQAIIRSKGNYVPENASTDVNERRTSNVNTGEVSDLSAEIAELKRTIENKDAEILSLKEKIADQNNLIAKYQEVIDNIIKQVNREF